LQRYFAKSTCFCFHGMLILYLWLARMGGLLTWRG
jgi:hypothetical protein